MKPFIYSLLIFPAVVFAQVDSVYTDSVTHRKVKVYQRDGMSLYYPKTKPIQFITKIPATFGTAAKMSFNKRSLPVWAGIAGSTTVLILLDQKLVDGVKQFSHFIHLDNTGIYHPVLNFNVGKQDILLYRAPGNFNTFLYQLGEGIPPVLIGTGLLTYGLIKKDYRAISTASQLAQGLVTMGIATQILKRSTGRESPFRATTSGGRWHAFPSFSNYHNNVSRFDAFPSGHLGTMMASVTIFAENYPEKRWIRPIGYSIMTLTALAMMNTEVHWAGDYPLALGLGYVCGMSTVKLNRWVKGTKQPRPKVRL